MKTKIIIIEDSYYKYITTKQILETKLRVRVQEVTIESAEELRKQTAEIKPDVIICRPQGGVVDLIEFFKERDVNRRNAEVILIAVPESCMPRARDLDALSPGRRKVSYAAAA